MCNPRRIRVRATRELAEAWEQEVRRQVTRRGEAVAEARVREPLESSIGRPTVTALVAVLSRTDGWEEDSDGVFRHQLADGEIAFYPETRELEIVARESAEVSSVGEAARVVRAEAVGTVEAEGVGIYYDDGWGGITQDDAQHLAERDLERAMTEAVRARRAQASQAADVEAGDAVQQDAARRADAAFASATAARAEELRRRAAESLIAVGVEGRNLFHQALAEAYRDAILAYARARHADNIRCSDTDGVVEIEFELQV